MGGPLDRVEELVDAEFSEQRGSWPNAPTAQDYVRHAESLGLIAQQVCDSSGSTGAYYTVFALYESEPIFAREPLGLVFQDFSKSEIATWVARV